jgi:GxxExxY protein
MSARRPRLLEERTTKAVLDSFRDVHRTLGFGYREHIYGLALERELVSRRHSVQRELAVMVYYKGKPLARQVFDMVVDARVIVENKASEVLHPEASNQLFSYLCSTNIEVGLLLHFGHEPKFYRVICENRFKQRNGPGQAAE